jgi:hypothetical protein
MEYVQGELVVSDCRVGRPNINYTDFVVEFDGRFLPEASAGGTWLLHFRDIGSCNLSLNVHHDGDVELYFKTAAAEDAWTDFSYPKAAHGGDQANHFLVIGKGLKFAVYLNGEPLSYVESGYCKYGDFNFLADDTVFALDNFKVWNIADISILPAQLPTQPTSPPTTAAASPTPAVILPTNATYLDWPLYLHSVYRFLFAVPPGWSLSQVGTNFIQLNAPFPSEARFTIGVRWADEDAQIQRTGVPEGDLVLSGMIPFWGDVISKSILVYEGKDKAVLYNNGTEMRVWDKVFTLSLGDFGLNYAAVDLTRFIDTADAIVGSIAPPE